MRGIYSIIVFLCAAGAFPSAFGAPLVERSESKGFLKQIDNSTWVIGNDLWNVTQGRQYATQLWYKGKDRVGKAVGHYVSYNGAQSDINYTSAAIVDSGSGFINVRFTAKEGDLHWVIYDGLEGAYQYYVNHALPVLGEFRSLWRLDNQSFPNGRTNIRDGRLPSLSEYAAATNVQDETWQKEDGTYLTKYDWSAVVREVDFHGVYGDEVGSWYISGKDHFNGNHLKQELMIHRESKTGDAVQLNMLHGTHYQAFSQDTFDNGKTWGPWLWYLNDGSKDDAAQRAKREAAAWPYAWFKDDAYQSRGSIRGMLVLSDGRPAAGAAIFLGDNNPTVSSLDQGRGYYYTTYADDDGNFVVNNVRSGTYGLEAWSNGGKIADVYTNISYTNIAVQKDKVTDLSTITWKVSNLQNRIFQVGDFDRKTTGFNLSGPTPFEHGRISKCPKNLSYKTKSSNYSDWCFGQSAEGTHSIEFPISSFPTNATGATLIVSLAGFSSGTAANLLLNSVKVGNISGNSTLLPSSQDTYRGATRSGEWHLLVFKVAKDTLKNGDNKLEFTVTSSKDWRGWLWDSIILEWT